MIFIPIFSLSHGFWLYLSNHREPLLNHLHVSLFSKNFSFQLFFASPFSSNFQITKIPSNKSKPPHVSPEDSSIQSHYFNPFNWIVLHFKLLELFLLCFILGETKQNLATKLFSTFESSLLFSVETCLTSLIFRVSITVKILGRKFLEQGTSSIEVFSEKSKIAHKSHQNLYGFHSLGHKCLNRWSNFAKMQFYVIHEK